MPTRGLLLTLDYLGESVATAEEADAATREYLRILDTIVESGIERNVSLKLTQLGLDVDRATCVDNLRRILEPATEHGFFVRIDMENSPYTDVTLQIFETLWGQGYRNIGVVLQSYLMRSYGDVRRMNALGARVRLVKGAYKEPKTVAYQKKSRSRRGFVHLMKLLLDEGTYPAIATHDPAMIDATKAHAAEKGYAEGSLRVPDALRHPPRSAGNARRRGLPRAGLCALRRSSGIPYFMRRLGERPANVAFVLKGIFREN